MKYNIRYTSEYIPKLQIHQQRKISTIQLKRRIRKGCKLYVVWVTDLLLNQDQTLVKYYPVLSNLMNLFPEEISGLPPQRARGKYLAKEPNLQVAN